LVASLVVPILSYYFIKRGVHTGDKKNSDGKKSMLDRLQGFYDSRIALTMSKPWHSIGIAILCIFIGISLLCLLPQETFPKLERNQFAVEIYFPEGTSLDANAKTTKKWQKFFHRIKELLT
jgi:multidrug efflux pump subunit AcrB